MPAGKQKEKKKAIVVPKKPADFYIVGMGASAGGLEAFVRFFRSMPNDPGMGFILVPHLDPTHVSLMPELIQKSSKMEVIPVKDGTRVKPNAVYIVPPNSDLAILNGTLQLLPPPKDSRPQDAHRLLSPISGGRPGGKGHLCYIVRDGDRRHPRPACDQRGTWNGRGPV